MAVGVFGPASSPDDDPREELNNPPAKDAPDQEVKGWLDNVNRKLTKWEAKQNQATRNRIQQARNESKPGRKSK